MKNKKYYLRILFFLILFFQFNFVLSEEFEFKAATIETLNKGNLIKGFGGVEINDTTELIITGDEFQYSKLDALLEVKGDVLIKDKFNYHYNLLYSKICRKIISQKK